MIILQYCIYLRKSRADTEAESRGEGETLARHEKALLELSNRLKLNITEIYKEVVSGETIAARPMMQKLLTEVEQGIWDGVLVMEVERLARGDTVDQGIMAQTFKFSGTKIITPMKTYDPNNEYDEEYFEFGLFMSRREYKTINRRLQRGRLASVKEGKFVANVPPYGYKRIKLTNDKGYTLEPNTDESPIVQMIFNLYTKGEMNADGQANRIGISLIVRRLNELKIPTRKGNTWAPGSIRDILNNPTYIGKVRWNNRPHVKKMVDGKLTHQRPRSNDVVIVDGLHQAIVDEETFNLAQNYMKNNPPRPLKDRSTVMNPLSGLVVCRKCGRTMVRRPYSDRTKYDTLMCPSTACDNVSVRLSFVEDRIISSLTTWLDELRLEWTQTDKLTKDEDLQLDIIYKSLSKLEEEIVVLNKQLDKIHNLLEQGIYTPEMFLDRSKLLSTRIEVSLQNKIDLEQIIKSKKIRDINKINLIPQVEYLLDVYHTLPTPQSKNDILKVVLQKVLYTKEKKGRWNYRPDEFEITLFPVINIVN